jgi:O-antigen/teichoic acid export membrane protein
MFKHTTTQKIAANTLYQMVGKVISMTITIAATMIITRMYGKEGYGAFNLMQSFPALFFIVVDFGINAIAVKELSQNFAQAQKFLGNILGIRIVLTLLFMTILGLALLFFPYDQNLKLGIYLSLTLILTQALYSTTNIIFQVKLRYDLSTIGYIAGSLVVLVLVLVMSYTKTNVIWVNFSYVIGGIVTFIINAGFMRSLGIKIKGVYFHKKFWRHILTQTLPLGLMFIFSQINFKADTIILSVHKLPAWIGLNNTESVAIYGLPYKIFEVSLVIPTFFMNSVYPVLVRHMLVGKNKLKNTFFKSFGALSLCGLFVGSTGILLAPFIIKILGGGAFGESVSVLKILLAGLIIFFITQPLAWLIVTLDKQKYLPFIYLTSAIFNLTANFIFIPKYSFYASSVITIISELIILVLLALAAKRAWQLKYTNVC